MGLVGVTKGLTDSGFILNREGIVLVGLIEYEIPTWSQIYELLLSEAASIRAWGYRADVVVGVIRGGLVPARVLTDLLEVPSLATLQVAFYVGLAQTAMEPVLKQPLTMSVDGKRVLLVDDIADTGRSLQLAQSYLQSQGALSIKTATLYYKPESIVKPDFYEKETRNWVVFPWEAQETLRKVLEAVKGKRQINHEVAKLIHAGLPQHLADRLLAAMQEHP